ncbi:polyhydroxyalkanoate synthesis regulator DNA-binding domain-containing protein [Candidatus Uabimicrobium sp. HlEnr_7]|uniref:polyhydroxyalkanoate synthesis regulator DNA-binding domain-containing protein n=1 Tax=Candidatus Uabimicrobium helgolandensis TaxID=3095367 RepID=UPI0035567BA9
MKKIIIKKYVNRRLYHTIEKKYITLEELAQVIQAGNFVEVIDNQSKKDITQDTLLQIILNEKKDSIFSTKLLHQLIKLQKDDNQEFLQFYLNASLDSYIKLKENMQQQFNMLSGWMNLAQMPNHFTNNAWEQLQNTLKQYEKKITDLEEKLKGGHE